MTQIKQMGPVEKEGNQKFMNVRISNDAIIQINALLRGDKGDVDDPKYQQLIKEMIDDTHEIWKILNPS